jgi:hypothetical protein
MKKEDDKVRVCFFSASDLLNSRYKNLLQSYPDKFLFVSKPISIPTMTIQIEHYLAKSNSH